MAQDQRKDAFADAAEADDENMVFKRGVFFWTRHNNSPDGSKYENETLEGRSASENSLTNPESNPSRYFTTFN
jgi:hypothetical protein